ncbi:MAG: ribonucleoside-diphosphate reductase [Pirellulaceae bacterium]|nr:MAG: ribonucleoside-diphosphate reductase [Pirellulaceae bacterium]
MNADPVRQLSVRKRDGRIVPFDDQRIVAAIEAAMAAEWGEASARSSPANGPHRAHQIAMRVVAEIVARTRSASATVDVEGIQDEVETQLMKAGEYRVARRYIVYREQRSRVRALRCEENSTQHPSIHWIDRDGRRHPVDRHRLKQRLFRACHQLPDCVATELFEDLGATIYEGIQEKDLQWALVMVARQRIVEQPSYSRVAVRLLLDIIYEQVWGEKASAYLEAAVGWSSGQDPTAPSPMEKLYRQGFADCIQQGVEAGRIDQRLREFDLGRLADALVGSRDEAFQYLGLQTLYDRYLLHVDGRRIETPQYFWMRVAMGLALQEADSREQWAIAFYELLSTFRFVSATPTLFNSGTPHPQLSSCYVTTVDDDLHHIFKCVHDNAMLSKWAGGLGNDWTRIRATGAHIRGTNGKSLGVIPFLKIVNDTALAVNQGGKRKGAVCAYLEPWHLDFEEFLELRKNTGDDRRRTHDMHTASWIPDLFLRRVRENGQWTLFSPDEVPELHESYGDEFAARYEEYERLADAGKIKLYRRVDAAALWRKMLSMLYETGHPWLTFKDPSNLRNPQDHVGVIHSSNLCTEILLNTSNAETAVCNLGSVNLAVHVDENGIRTDDLAATVRTAVRMLDNVIDINFYPTEEAAAANRRHRPIGLGMMGFQDALFIQRIPYASSRAVEFADEVTELISFHAILASAELAHERGTYPTYAGSKWERGLLPIDTIDLLRSARRPEELDMDDTCRLDWTPVRQAIAAHGMRNCNVMAIAPTATISNIAGCSQSIEPTYRNLFVKSNLSGDFTIVNTYLQADLKRLGLWDREMIDDLKYHDGELEPIQRIPEDIKELYRTAFDIAPEYLIEANSRRQKWVDQGISFNLYLSTPDGRALSDMYFTCWRKGLKTTYYLRALAATQIEKASVDINRFGIQPKWMKNRSPSSEIVAGVRETHATVACSIDDPDCEACQ